MNKPELEYKKVPMKPIKKMKKKELITHLENISKELLSLKKENETLDYNYNILVGENYNLKQQLRLDPRLKIDNFREFIEFEFKNNKEWFEGYTSYTDNDYDAVASENVDELWDVYIKEYGGKYENL